MNRHLFGWDLPPGVNASDIPGNRPEDEAWDKTLDEFYASLKEPDQAKLDTHQGLWDIVGEAIAFGIKKGKEDE